MGDSRRRRNHQRGSTISEMPIALWIIVLICFACVMLATKSIRFGFFWNACREAAQQACKCQTFQNDSTVGPSSVTVAKSVANIATKSFTGITLQNVNVYIVDTNPHNANGSVKSAANTKLAAAADVVNDQYDIQVELIGQVDPLIRFPASFLGNVPGLTEPFPMIVRSTYSSECPQGLNQ